MYFVKYMAHNGSLAIILKFIRRITLTSNYIEIIHFLMMPIVPLVNQRAITRLNNMTISFQRRVYSYTLMLSRGLLGMREYFRRTFYFPRAPELNLVKTFESSGLTAASRH